MVPALTPSQQQELAAGRGSLDDLTRRFVRDHLTYRFVVTADGAQAARLEVEVRRGALLGGDTVSESPVATEAPLTSKVTISGWSTKRLEGRQNIFLNQPTDLTLGEGSGGRIVRLSGGMVTLQDAVDAFSARAACHVFREAPRKFSITPSRRPLRAAVASGATFQVAPTKTE